MTLDKWMTLIGGNRTWKAGDQRTTYKMFWDPEVRASKVQVLGHVEVQGIRMLGLPGTRPTPLRAGSWRATAQVDEAGTIGRLFLFHESWIDA